MKRLYIVSVTIEYAVMAENAQDAAAYISEAVNDDSTIEERAEVTLAASDGYAPPDQWDSDVLVYGTVKDTTFAQAVTLDHKAAEVKP